MNRIILVLLMSAVCLSASAQMKKVKRTTQTSVISQINPPTKNLYKVNNEIRSTSTFNFGTPLSMDQVDSRLRVIHSDSDQSTIWIQGIPESVESLRSSTLEDQVSTYLKECSSLIRIPQAQDQFQITRVNQDDLGTKHIRLQQFYKGIPVDGAEIMIHGSTDLNKLNGNPYPITIEINTTPSITEEAAKQLIKRDFQDSKPWNDPWNIIDIEREKVELVIHRSTDGPRLSYKVGYHPTMIDRWEYIIDAHSGDVIDKVQTICKFHNLHLEDVKEEADGPSSSVAPDLFGSNRTIQTFEVSGGFYMIDGSRTMYDAVNSVMPNEPVGVIWTIDAFNTSPERDNFTYDHVFSADNSWSGQQTQVSAHYNAGKTYEYFKSTHGRESINDDGSNIISLVNIADSDGSSLENAFWNGVAMFYGNGGTAFEPLAKACDVAAHEISHGVIQNTANLEYKGESGALNESYADIFGVLVDRDDYLLGEDVVKPAAFPSGALRNMMDPHNGAATNDYNRGYQPKNVNEQFTGPEDNGGVHINSGIPNHAFYLFAEDVGKDKAELVYYRALTTYLLKSSQFIDQRLAVIQSAVDLYGNGSEAQAARDAFDAVGIFDGDGGNYQEDEEVNPGSGFLLVADNAQSNLYLYDEALNIIANPLSEMDLVSKPSVTDDGEIIVFVGSDKRMYFISIDWVEGTFTAPEVFQDQPIWDNVIISKDGSRIAGIFEDVVPQIWVYDFSLEDDNTFELYNPTFTEGVSTGDVRYPDAMEFDFSGEYIMYDALNEITSTQSGSIEYWDVGFLKVWDNASDFWSLGSIEKLFSALPEGISVGNPTFSKNSDYIIAFDVIEGAIADLYGANLQTGELNVLFSNSTLNYPSYNIDDTKIVHDLNLIGTLDLGEFTLDATKINTVPSSESIILEDSRWGVWFANGSRDFSSSLDEEQQLELITSYPNPAQEVLNVGFISEGSGPARIEIFGVNGKRMMIQNIDAVNGPNEHPVDVREMRQGMYLCRITSQGKVGSFLFFKQ
ncbi:MAG: T9SS type A sorting domain-containing protein [Saprospiraceae bacterium]|nr:T9SS type A sorting domain-containing protein [Saprospiraceae bacterium]